MEDKDNYDFFGDGLRIFLDYIGRQYNKNPEYKPHPLIRAFECAVRSADGIEDGKCAAGVSQEGTENSVYEPYIVVLEKKEEGLEVKEIRNLKVNKKIPVDIMILIFRLQIHLDKIDGDTVNPKQAVDALNEVIPGEKFYALGSEWKKARDEFKRLLESGNFKIPYDPEIIEELKKITYDTPWEEYSNKLRSMIGSSIVKKSGTITITSPESSKIEKYKIFDIMVESLLGQSSAYLNWFGQDKEEKND